MELLPAFREQAIRACVSVPTEDEAACKEPKHTDETRLLLQGQLRFLEEWNAMIFLCNPLLVFIIVAALT